VTHVLADALKGADDAAQAAQIVVDHLVAAGLSKPSVYLARGERLRIQAIHGYQQVFDGIPAGAGLTGRALASGQEEIVDDVRSEPGYLRASAGVRAEMSVPLFRSGRVAGVLNVESSAPLTAPAITLVREAARALEASFVRLGDSLGESPSQRLARHALRLNELDEERRVRDEVVVAACDVADMASGALVLPDAGGRFSAVAATGVLGEAVARLPQATLDSIAAVVQSGASCYTLGGSADTGDELLALRTEGIQAVIAVPLEAGGGRTGVLLLGDPRPLRPATDIVELVEVLAAHAASSLRTVRALDELRDRAATDPLTGLGHHATFHEALARARRGREPLAVLLADIDGFKAINDTRGHQAGDRTLRETAAALSSALRRGDELFRIGGDEFAAIVHVADADEALDAGRRLRQAVLEVGDVTVSIGVALPLAGESDQAALARADAALYEVKAAGRDGVALLS
jgi:diguanylate cyclase (GGDEF)-like protein